MSTSETKPENCSSALQCTSIDDLMPYLVTVTILRGENLAIMDCTTSDPYVEVEFNDKKIGKTPVVKRNHLTPVWNYTLKIGLFHLHQHLIFKVYDEDTHKEDDIMGLIDIDLTSRRNFDGNEHKFAVMKANDPDLEAQGFIYLSFTVEKRSAHCKVKEITKKSQTLNNPSGINFYLTQYYHLHFNCRTTLKERLLCKICFSKRISIKLSRRWLVQKPSE